MTTEPPPQIIVEEPKEKKPRKKKPTTRMSSSLSTKRKSDAKKPNSLPSSPSDSSYGVSLSAGSVPTLHARRKSGELKPVESPLARFQKSRSHSAENIKDPTTAGSSPLGSPSGDSESTSLKDSTNKKKSTKHKKTKKSSSKTKDKPVYTLLVRIIRGTDLQAADKNGFSDPYVRIRGADFKWKKTKVVKKCLNPQFSEVFEVNIHKHLYVQVYDHDVLKDDLIGDISLKVRGVNPDVHSPFPVKGVEHVQSFPLSGKGSIELGLTPVNDWRKKKGSKTSGIESSPDTHMRIKLPNKHCSNISIDRSTINPRGDQSLPSDAPGSVAASYSPSPSLKARRCDWAEHSIEIRQSTFFTDDERKMFEEIERAKQEGTSDPNDNKTSAADPSGKLAPPGEKVPLRESQRARLAGITPIKTESLNDMYERFQEFAQQDKSHRVVYVDSKESLLEFCIQQGFLTQILELFPFKMNGETYQGDVEKVLRCEEVRNAISQALISVFDKNGDGKVQFEELIAGISVLAEGSQKEKAELQFKIADANRDGVLNKEELKEMIKFHLAVAKAGFMINLAAKKSQLKLLGLTDEQIDKMSSEVMEQMNFKDFIDSILAGIYKYTDKDSNGEITREEYISWFTDSGQREEGMKQFAASMNQLQGQFSDEIKKTLRALLESHEKKILEKR